MAFLIYLFLLNHSSLLSCLTLPVTFLPPCLSSLSYPPGDDLNAGDIIRIGNVSGRDYVIGSRSVVMRNTNPRYFPLLPFFSLDTEEEIIVPRVGNFVYSEYVRSKELLMTPTALGFTFDLRNMPTPVIVIEDSDENEEGLKEVEEEVVEEKKEKGGEGGGEGEKQLSRDIDNPNRPKPSVENIQSRSEIDAKKENAQNDFDDKNNANNDSNNNNQNDHGNDSNVKHNKNDNDGKDITVIDHDNDNEDEEENEEDVLKEVWLWKCVPQRANTRPRWRVQYDEGLIKFTHKYEDVRLNDVYSYLGVFVTYQTLEVMCTDVRCIEMVSVPYLQRADEMAVYSDDDFVRIIFEVMVLQWTPIKVRTKAYNHVLTL
jgi:hypothetical protein